MLNTYKLNVAVYDRTAALEASHRRSSGSIRDYVWVFPTSATFGVLLEALPSYGRRHIPMAPLIRPEMKMTVARDSIAVIITDPVLLLGMAPTASAQVKSVFGCAGHPQILSKHRVAVLLRQTQRESLHYGTSRLMF